MSEPTPGSTSVGPPGDFHVWRDIDRLDRRIDVVGTRLDQMDQTGTRGVELLRQEVSNLTKDIHDHEKLHQDTAAAQSRSRQFLIATVVALIGPLYPLVVWLQAR